MNFNYNNKQVRDLLGHKYKQLCIPRYQRDYSWERNETEEFLNDILSGLSLNGAELERNEYFLGTILLAGDFNNQDKVLEVIDGQQRVTTLTILLSVLAKKFYKLEQDTLGDKVWAYVMKEDDDGREYKALDNDTTSDYFRYLIQMKAEYTGEVVDDEQERIAAANNFYSDELEENKVKNRLNKINSSTIYSKVDYLKILKALRDQILDCTIICLSTDDKKSENSLFEILNAKGKKLESIDLIKNEIFSNLDSTEPTDHANNIWKSIKKSLISREKRIEFSQFYRHYWISKHKKVKNDELYDEFKKEIDKKDYTVFLEKLERNSNIYVKIINPYPSDYSNRKEKMYIVECLKYFTDYFNIKQIRVALLALINIYNFKKILTNKRLEEILTYLHGFHFAYNALCTKRSNALESKYSKFANNLNNCDDKESINKVISEFIKEIDAIFPEYSEFEKAFIKLEYSNKLTNKTNLLCKYVLNNIEEFHSKTNVSPQDGTVEHILPEGRDVFYSVNIGNLLLLEGTVNEKADNKEFAEKIEDYQLSSYKSVDFFVAEYKETSEWDESIIGDRAKEMARFYYENILGRK